MFLFQSCKHRSMFFFGGGGGASPPKVSRPQSLPPPPPVYMPMQAPVNVATKAEPNADTTGDNKNIEERRKMKADTVGRQDTILTSGLGVTEDPSTKKKTLLVGNS
jgi:hypothetical protein